MQYETRPVHGRKPLPRGYHGAFLAESRVYILGGFNGSDVFDDLHCLELAAASYLPQVTGFGVDLEAEREKIEEEERRGDVWARREAAMRAQQQQMQGQQVRKKSSRGI
jgi:hypothetical protein